MRTSKKFEGSAVDHVADCITNEIISGELRTGDRLPTETELAEKYGVGRNTVREAIKQLQAFGVLYIKRADGTYVNDSYTAPRLNLVFYSMLLKKKDWDDFIELRSVIDTGILHEVLKKPGSESVVPALKALVSDMEAEIKKPEPSIDSILELDLKFHCSIAALLENPLIDVISDQIVRMMEPSCVEATRKYLKNGHIERFLRVHLNIADVIARKDVPGISRAVCEHYELISYP